MKSIDFHYFTPWSTQKQKQMTYPFKLVLTTPAESMTNSAVKSLSKYKTRCESLTLLDIVPLNIHMIIAIRPRMFMNDSESVHRFMEDRADHRAILANQNRLLTTSLANHRRTSKWQILGFYERDIIEDLNCETVVNILLKARNFVEIFILMWAFKFDGRQE